MQDKEQRGTLEHRSALVASGPLLKTDTRLVLQVSGITSSH